MRERLAQSSIQSISGQAKTNATNGAHYDPESALGNKGRQRRVAPVHQTINASNKGLPGAKLGGRGAQPT